MMFPYPVTVTVERPTGTDRHGNPLPPESHDLHGVALAPPGSTLSSEGIADNAQVEWDLDLLTHDTAADIRETDRVVIPAGHPYAGTYEVHGHPRFYVSPFTGSGGTVARLKGVRG